jgi:uncharacterized membrane protein
MMPRSEVQPLEMSVDAALKYIVSMGVVAPAPNAAALKRKSLPPNE